MKDQPRRSKAYLIEEMLNKSSRLNASGAYSSSNQDNENADPMGDVCENNPFASMQ